MAEDNEEIPRWFLKYLETQSIPSSSNASDKRPKPSGNLLQPPKKSRPSCDSDSDDDFDKRFGYLFNHDVCDTREQEDLDLEIDDNSQDVNNNYE